MREITYVHTRVRTTDFIYDVELDGEWVAAAVNYSAAEKAASEVLARQQLLAMIEDEVKQARAQAESVEHLACYVCGAPAPHIACNGPLCSYHYSGWLEWKQAQAEQAQAEQAQAEQGGMQCPCGDQALYFVQAANGKVYAYCVECWQQRDAFTLPLLAQCASVIRRCLGRTSGPEGIIDELRRVEAELSREGW